LKGIPFKSFPKKQMPSLSAMASNPNSRANNIPFMCASCNNGSTDYPPGEVVSNSIGRPRYFFRLNFSSALVDLPYGYFEWTNFIASGPSEYAGIPGDIRRDEWNRNPEHPSTFKWNPFMSLDAILPSRYVLAFSDTLEGSFLPLDAHKIGCGPSRATILQTTDLGDDILHYKKGNPTNGMEAKCLLHPNLVSFLKEAL
jgi:hypothetical protein